MHKDTKTKVTKALAASLFIVLTAFSAYGCGSGNQKSKEESPAAAESSSAAGESAPSPESTAEVSEKAAASRDSSRKSDKSDSRSAQKDNAIEIDLNSDCEKLTAAEIEDLTWDICEEYYADAAKDPERIKETTYSIYETKYDEPGDRFEYGTIRYQGYEMKYGIQIIGEPDENGTYPLYIALHGGGEGDSETNDEQWEDMFYYYSESVTNGIYVNVRGISNTWNLHFMDESYPMYDRLIEDMILFENADANRVYLLGFSAGGDGVYQVSARMADRFAAANMSSGHPNGISLENLMNLPILLQAGIRDNAFDRNTITAEYGLQLDGFAEKYGRGYEHDVLIHVPEGHNYADNEPDETVLQEVVSDPSGYLSLMKNNAALREVVNEPEYAYAIDEEVDNAVYDAADAAGLKTELADANAVRWVSQYNRNPYPENLVWDLDTRAAKRSVESFYYLKAPAETKGKLKAFYNQSKNKITIDTSEADGDFTVLFNPFMLDLSRPVTLCIDDKTFKVNVAPSEECIRTSLEETSDFYRAYAAEISCSELLSYAAAKQQ